MGYKIITGSSAITTQTWVSKSSEILNTEEDMWLPYILDLSKVMAARMAAPLDGDEDEFAAGKTQVYFGADTSTINIDYDVFEKLLIYIKQYDIFDEETFTEEESS